jgi:SAM-dependent methyltransferase
MMRDTDRDWQAIGETEPYFGVLANPKYLKVNRNKDAEAEFWGGGDVDVAYALNTLRSQFGPFEPKTAIDFGCGVGRLTRAIAKHVDHVTGIDISPGMLREARMRAPSNAIFQNEIPDGAVDWIVSHIVFQHIPPARGYSIFEQLLAHLALGGCMSMHFTIYKDREFIDQALRMIEAASWDGEVMRTFSDREHPSGTMLMYDYDLSRLMQLSHSAGIEGVYCTHINHGGCHGVMLFGRKSR